MAIWYNKKYIEVLLKGGAVLGKQVLLINDLPGYGEVALAAMMPILTHMGHHIYNLPTALVSIPWIMGSLKSWTRRII